MYKRYFPAFLTLSLLLSLCGTLAGEITPAGKQLAESLDKMEVETHWLAGKKINWRTGVDTGKEARTTHCSAFAAAASEKLGVYLLRPPEHSTALLANAQQIWLLGPGKEKGWKPVKTPIEAQHLANTGRLVIVSYKEHDPKKPGHIAIVRPSTKSEKEILADGPQIIQAGGSNYNSTSTREGFKRHPGAWKNGELLYFEHSLEAEKPPAK